MDEFRAEFNGRATLWIMLSKYTPANAISCFEQDRGNSCLRHLCRGGEAGNSCSNDDHRLRFVIRQYDTPGVEFPIHLSRRMRRAELQASALSDGP